MLATKGHRVVLVDADPQCNLSGLVLGYKGPKEFETFYEKEPERNIRAGLAPAFESRPKEIEAIECVPVEGNPNLVLLPGHIGLSEYEQVLGLAQESSGFAQTLKDLPGSFSYLFAKTGKEYDADYLLIDTDPCLSSINKNVVMTSDYFVVPTSADGSSILAIDSLTAILPEWRAWSRRLSEMTVFRDANYPFPRCAPMFLGTIMQKDRPRQRAKVVEVGEGTPDVKSSRSLRGWINAINTKVTDQLVPILRRLGMTFEEAKYRELGLAEDFCLASIPDFSSLIAKSYQSHVPVFSLTDDQIGLRGASLRRALESKSMLEEIYSILADEIVELTSDVAST